jgi:cytosine/adenosine deaminase-related metal-dependent hydrolase
VDHLALHQAPGADPYSQLVYACSSTDVRLTVVDGEIVARDGELTWADRAGMTADARAAARGLMDRAGLT